MKHQITKTITAMLLVVIMAIGMLSSLSAKADAATTIKITYNLNGGTWKAGNTTQTYTYGIKFSLTPPNCVKTGYTLRGWNTKSDGSGTMYQSGQTNAMFSSNTTLYAIWRGNTCRITYNENGGQVGAMGSNGMSQTFTVGNSVTLSPPSFYRNGYELLGFSTNSKATTADYKKGKSYKFNCNQTLYAVWRKYPVVSVKVNGKVTSSTTVVNGTYTLPAAPSVDKGKRFVKWVSESDPNGSGYNPGAKVSITKDTTFIPVTETIYESIYVVKVDSKELKVWVVAEAHKDTFYKDHPESKITIIKSSSGKNYQVRNSYLYGFVTVADVCNALVAYNKRIGNTKNWNRSVQTCYDEWLFHNALYDGAIILDKVTDMSETIERVKHVDLDANGDGDIPLEIINWIKSVI